MMEAGKLTSLAKVGRRFRWDGRQQAGGAALIGSDRGKVV